MGNQIHSKFNHYKLMKPSQYIKHEGYLHVKYINSETKCVLLDKQNG